MKLFLFSLLCFFQLLLGTLAFHDRILGRPFDGQESYSGYIEVDQKNGGNMFYWFFEAENGNESAPVVLWLQGGPGSSSMIGLFAEMGPFKINDNLQLEKNPFTWNKEFHMIFIDNPVGTGFSYVESENGYVKSETEMAANLYKCLTTFFETHPKYKSCDFYITGESYGGKYVPALAYYILQQRNSIVNLKGLAIGDGLTDPETQVQVHPSNAYNFGLIDEKQKDKADLMAKQVVAAIRSQDWIKAVDLRESLLQFIQNCSGFPNFYDIRTYEQYNFSRISEYLNQPSVRKQLHVGNHIFQIDSSKAYENLKSDVMKSVKYMFPDLLKNYNILLYQGQFDAQDGVAMNQAWIKTIPWSGRDSFLDVERNVWKVDQSVAGFVRKYKTLTQIVVVGAGHLSPMNQPRNTQEMIKRWIEGSFQI